MPLDIDNAKGELVVDPYRFKERYRQWDRKLPGISPENEAIIVRYLEDMRRGLNVRPGARKGKRGFHRLVTQRDRLARLCKLLSAHFSESTIAPSAPEDIKRFENSVTVLFEKMEDGEIRRLNGARFLSVQDQLKGFKAYWHWYMTYMKRERDLLVPDITEFMTVRSQGKPTFVYFGQPGQMPVEDGFRRLFEHANYRYRPLISFLFDSGIRAPTELVNVKRKDITPIPSSRYFELNIRDETSKTYGRRIKLMFCHEQLRAHIENGHFAPDDFIFPISPRVTNQYLKRLGQRALGKEGITMYDFRHNSVCYFLPRYKNENALMYRFGWKDSKEIHYYSEFLGMKDTLQEDDFLVDVSKTQIEKELEAEKRRNERLDEELGQLRAQMASINRFMNRLTEDEETVVFLARKARSLKFDAQLSQYPLE